MRERNVFRLFLASPSDVTAERQLVIGVVNELNSTVARHLGIVLELARWEDMVPGLGEPQEIILRQADLENVDIFIGILWNRFGTPTSKARSGTEEEFELARQFHDAVGKPGIMLYFCQRPANFTTPDQLEQKARLLEFRARIERIALIREFSELEGFQNLLRQDLTNHLFSLTSPPTLPVRGPDHRITSRSVEAPPGMVRIKQGSFRQGRAHQTANIENDFWIDVYPVTYANYAEFLEATGFMSGSLDAGILRHLERLRTRAEIKASGVIMANHPAANITWYEALAYAAWLKKRLPTALEWERAAAGTAGNIYPWGNDFDSNRCNHAGSRVGTTTPVDYYPNGRSEDGCYDMAGNVFEWTDDWSPMSRFSSAPASEKVNKGGSYVREASDLVNWYEESDPPDLRLTDVGFRCAWSPEWGA